MNKINALTSEKKTRKQGKKTKIKAAARAWEGEVEIKAETVGAGGVACLLRKEKKIFSFLLSLFHLLLFSSLSLSL